MRSKPWGLWAERSDSTVTASAEWTVTEADRTKSRADQPSMLLGRCEGMPALLLHGAAVWELHADGSTTLLNA